MLSDQIYGVTAGGTMAHAWVQTFDTQYDAFRAYCEIYPDNPVLLVDTYNTLKSGVPNAIQAFKEVLVPQGIRDFGIRLDSGDLAYLTRQARKMLDEAGYPNIEIIAKLNGSDILPGGVAPEILAASAKELEKVGVAMITVNAGGGLTRLEGMSGDGHRAEGWKVPLAEIVKAAVSIPVAASGNLKHPPYVDSIIKDGRCDLVALGRTTIADPYWVSKCAAGREDLIRYCLSCMHCIYAQPRKECGCTMNPRCRRESFVPEIESLPKVGNGRKVMVIGAGPAGCAAAIALAQRGFKPIICEKADYIGGMMLVAGMPIGKQEFQYGIGYYMNMLKELKVEARLNTCLLYTSPSPRD